MGGQEENLRAALLLEQAALCLLRVSPPSVRKYAFHMVLAGLRYNACDQKALGMRAYRSALHIFCFALYRCTASTFLVCTVNCTASHIF